MSQNFEHPSSGSGKKKMFKWYLKSDQTNGGTDTRTHGRTFQLIERISPEGQFFENRPHNSTKHYTTTVSTHCHGFRFLMSLQLAQRINLGQKSSVGAR